jgi:hypothetical protein
MLHLTELKCNNTPAPQNSVWSEAFAGDMHGCVPLNLVNSKAMRLRPASQGDEYELSQPIIVPVEPVTGESVFVSCKPKPGSDCAPMYFRVRLDAKKPIGGHEERMRIVISIHPALRVQNLLPFAMQVSVYAVPPARPQGDLIASIMPSEGAVEQLHCTELKTPLHMSAMMPHFRKVKQHVLVYHPDPGTTTSKTIEMYDDQGAPLHLGVETTTSAWGDLTIIFFAQYLMLNFSCLPITYGIYGTRAVKPCAGQAVTASPDVSPIKSKADTDEFHPDHATYALHGIYAVFGPRSSFHGRLIPCRPPMADTDIQNGDELKGNIALIHRGAVPFTVKARRAAAAGAVGVVFINSDDTTFLAEGDSGPGIRISCVMLTKSDGQVHTLLDLHAFHLPHGHGA